MFINVGFSHLTSQFCIVELDPTTISKIVLEPPPRSVGQPAIKFPLSDHPPFMSMLQMSNPEREGVCLKLEFDFKFLGSRSIIDVLNSVF